MDASFNEYGFLWQEWHDKVRWEEGPGWLEFVGQVCITETKPPTRWAELVQWFPTTINLRVSTLGGHPVMFYSPASLIVAHDLIDRWLEEKFPLLLKERRRCNTSNFHHCMRYILDPKEET